MLTHRTGSSAAVRAAALAALLAACACTSVYRVDVRSTPPGARIFVDGADTGQTTPDSILCSSDKNDYSIRLEKPGFNPLTREVELRRDVTVMGPKEAVTNVCCAPCTCGFSLLGFLSPVKSTMRFVPDRIDATLEVAGQGVSFGALASETFEVYVDGKLQATIVGPQRNYVVMPTGDHELTIKAQGYRNFVRTVHVVDGIYQEIAVDLALEGQGLLLTATPEGAKAWLDDQFQGTLGKQVRTIAATPGPHMVRVELEGYRPWQDVVQVSGDGYKDLHLDLVLEGQGIILRKPEGLPIQTPPVQILVGGQLRGSAFDKPLHLEPGDFEIEIRVGGRETRKLQVHVTQDEWLEVQAGPKENGHRRPDDQVLLEAQGIRVHAPDPTNDEQRRTAQILVDDELRATGLDHFVPLEAGAHNVELRVDGFKPWKQSVHVMKKQSLDVYPVLERK